jgi:prenylcysteine oxidase/farnesylcysteine lyase
MNNRSILLVLYLLVGLACVTLAQRVAIVGGGIGAATTSFYLKNKLPYAEIIVYEKTDRLGGRLDHIKIENYTLEKGGENWIRMNKYVDRMARELGIPLDEEDTMTSHEPIKVLIWRKDREWVPFELGQPSLDNIRFLAEVEKFKYHCLENYLARGADLAATEDLKELLDYGEWNKYTNVSFGDWLRKASVSDQFITEQLDPILRVIYEQNEGINAFAGFVSFLDTFEPLGATHGNRGIVETALKEKADKVLFNTPVRSIEYEEQSGQYVINNQDKFDYVVVAVPLEFANIESRSVKLLTEFKPRKFVGKAVTHVIAEGFNLEYLDGKVPEPNGVFTTHDSTAPFYSVTRKLKLDEKRFVYKFFSPREMTREELNKVLKGISYVHTTTWEYTFPQLDPINEYQPMQLHQKLFYINGIESAASAMEGSALSARNIALLIAAKETRGDFSAVSAKQKPVFALPYLEKIISHPWLQYFVLFITGAYYGSIYSAMDIRSANSPREFFAIIQFVLTAYLTGFWTEYIISFLVPFTAALQPRDLAVMSGGEIVAGILLGLGMILSHVVTPAALVLKIKNLTNQTRRASAVLTVLGVTAAIVLCVTANESLQSLVGVVSYFSGGVVPQPTALDLRLNVLTNLQYSFIFLALLLVLSQAENVLNFISEIQQPKSYGALLGLWQAVYILLQFGPSFHSGYALSSALNPLGIGVNSVVQICAIGLGLFVQYQLTSKTSGHSAPNDIARGGVREQHKEDPIYNFVGAVCIVLGLYLQKSSLVFIQALFILVLVKAFVSALK